MKIDFGSGLFCRDCKYSWWSDIKGSTTECRFNPPTQIGKDGLAVFPLVHLDEHWCAQGKTFGWQREQQDDNR